MGRPSNIVVVNEDYRKLAERFYRHQTMLGYVPHSTRSKFLTLCEFLQWLQCQGNTDITSVTAIDIEAYQEYISSRPSKKDGGTLNPKTVHRNLWILRDFFEMLLQER
ncbi:MAG: hypothetical protein ACRDE2_12120, partial [Chitinophagaceae bacterium]